jgi:hypothetical protein
VFAHVPRRCSGCGVARASRGSPRTSRARLPAGDDRCPAGRGRHRARRGGVPRGGACSPPLAAAAVLAIMINAVLLKLGNGFFVNGPHRRRRCRVLGRARARRGVPGAHRARPHRARQRPRLAPAPASVWCWRSSSASPPRRARVRALASAALSRVGGAALHTSHRS